MEETVMGLMNLVSGAANWGIGNAVPLIVGALLGQTIVKTGAGVVSDLLGRAKGLIDDTASAITKK